VPFFSILAFSNLALLTVPPFPVSHFQSPPVVKQFKDILFDTDQEYNRQTDGRMDELTDGRTEEIL